MIVIVDSGVANVGSIANMLKKVGAPAMISSDPEVIRDAEKLILPGVGAFDAGMQHLRDRKLIEPLTQAVCSRVRPILGICLGMQLLTQGSEEGVEPGLGWVEADVVRFAPTAGAGDGRALRVPHMGWNTLVPALDASLFAELAPDARFYFVHSYHVRTKREDLVIATSVYGYPFVSAFRHNNIFGVQFHPEKSHRFGMKVLRNFAALQ